MSVSSEGESVREIDVRALAQRAAELRIIDVREAPELVGPLGFIAHSENVPLGVLTTESQRWARDQAIAVVCRTGKRSRQGVVALQQLGFVNVVNVAGGMTAWAAAALPIERTP